MDHKQEKQIKYSMRKKQRQYEPESSEEEEQEDMMPESKGKRKSRQRQENSLGELTKNFINYIKSQGGREININEVVKELKVKKRRIYDITNVLEGIGYIRKLAKNKIQWLKDELYVKEEESEEEEDIDPEDMNEVSERENLEKELHELAVEESKLDNWVEKIKNQFEKLTENNDFKDYGYVTFDDIKALTAGEEINLIAIKAPTGTSLEIPDPEQINSIYNQTFENMKSGKDEWDQSLLDSLEKKYQLFLDSPNGEINVYLVLNKLDEDSKSEISIKTQSNVPSTTIGQNLPHFSNNNFSHSSFNRQAPLQQNKSYKNIQKNYPGNSDNPEIINNFS